MDQTVIFDVFWNKDGRREYHLCISLLDLKGVGGKSGMPASASHATAPDPHFDMAIGSKSQFRDQLSLVCSGIPTL